MAIGLKKNPYIFCLMALLATTCSVTSMADDLFKSSSGFLNPSSILPVDEAFKLRVLSSENGSRLVWDIAEGYYLYKDRVEVESEQNLLPLQLPDGLPKDDPHFGRVAVYYGQLEVEIKLPEGAGQADGDSTGTEKERVTVSYQGCADVGVCYPPRTQEVDI